ncbi:MAG TPA: hypothetical protein VFH27_10940 [Longimicrobiaceae bacterium]|nr:hypothetical protein [Longimicrobiaceae bacterium]
MAIREGRWDCPQCRAVGNLGRHTECPTCGASRSSDTQFYLPEDAPEVSDAALLAEAEAGADWICEHCYGSSRASEERCSQCGAPRGSSPVVAEQDYDLDEVPTSGTDRRTPAPVAAEPDPPTRKRNVRAGLVTVLAVIFGTCWFLNRPYEVDGRVAALHWDRTVKVEEYRTVRESDWSVPPGGREVDHHRAVHHHNQVLDHYETRSRQVSERVQTGSERYTCGRRSKGNGYYSDKTCTRPTYTTRYHTETYRDPVYVSVPVYATRYDFDIEKWVPGRVLKEEGATTATRWPAVKLAANERDAGHEEHYVVRFTDAKGRDYAQPLPEITWRLFSPGHPVRMRVNSVGHLFAAKEPTGAAAWAEPEK